MLALDLDGSCLDSDLQLHPRVRAAVRRAVASGITVVVATGRMYRSTVPWARELGVTAPVVCYQGAMVRALPGLNAPEVNGIALGDVTREHSLDAETALLALDAARVEGWHFQAYQDEQLLCEQDRSEAREYSRIAQVPITFVEDLHPLVVRRGSIKAVCIVDDPTEANRCEARMRALLAGRALVTRSQPQFVEITSLEASKGRALTELCGHLGIPMSATAAVGDAPNDIDMLAAVAYAVAAGTTDPRLLIVADAVCAGPRDAGVADVIDLLLAQQRDMSVTH